MVDNRVIAAGGPLVAFAGLMALMFGAGPAGPVAGILGLVVGGLAELSAREMPNWSSVQTRLGWTLWILPAASTLAAGLAVTQLDPRLARVVPPLGAAIVACAVMLQRSEVSESQSSNSYRIGFHILSYVTAFALFTLIYQTKERSLMTGTATAISSALLATVLLREATVSRQRTLLYAGMIGLVTGEVTWAVNYWVVLALIGGALLLLVFYLLVGLTQAILDRNLDRRVVIEYTVVGLLGFALILSTGPWRL